MLISKRRLQGASRKERDYYFVFFLKKGDTVSLINDYFLLGYMIRRTKQAHIRLDCTIHSLVINNLPFSRWLRPSRRNRPPRPPRRWMKCTNRNSPQSRTVVFRWRKLFLVGKTTTEFLPIPGRPTTTACNDVNVNTLATILQVVRSRYRPNYEPLTKYSRKNYSCRAKRQRIPAVSGEVWDRCILREGRYFEKE